MMRLVTVLSGVALMTFALPAAAQSDRSLPNEASLKAPFADPKEIRIGKKYWQKANFYAAKTAEPAPLVVFLELGIAPDGTSLTGWPRFRINGAGYAVAFVPYVDSTPHAQEMADYYALAIAHFRATAAELHIDPDRIVLAGRGVMAHFALLLGTDSHYLEAAGVRFPSIRGIMSLSGTGFDVPHAVERNGYANWSYRTLFGTDAAEQRRLSPIAHLEAPNAPAFLIRSVANDPISSADSHWITEALMRSGVNVRSVEAAELRKGDRKSYFMLEPDGDGSDVIGFLQERFGPAPAPAAN